jgi:hypothetical protein
MSPVFLACLFSTFAMTGLIWLIQVVSYPLMSLVPQDHFVAYEAAHCRRISPVVLPLMTCELFTAIWLCWKPPMAEVRTLLLIGGGLTILLWFSTFFIQVPLHSQLEKAYSQTAWERLVQTNWIRTFLWSARSVVMARALWQLSAPQVNASP